VLLGLKHDPLIRDREKALRDFCIRVKNLTTEAQIQDYLRDMQSFNNPPPNEEATEENLDNASEASLDMNIFEAVKNELEES
jgi:hypothetical protein